MFFLKLIFLKSPLLIQKKKGTKSTAQPSRIDFNCLTTLSTTTNIGPEDEFTRSATCVEVSLVQLPMAGEYPLHVAILYPSTNGTTS
jgi:hypothetical protein